MVVGANRARAVVDDGKVDGETACEREGIVEVEPEQSARLTDRTRTNAAVPDRFASHTRIHEDGPCDEVQTGGDPARQRQLDTTMLDLAKNGEEVGAAQIIVGLRHLEDAGDQPEVGREGKPQPGIGLLTNSIWAMVEHGISSKRGLA